MLIDVNCVSLDDQACRGAATIEGMISEVNQSNDAQIRVILEFTRSITGYKDVLITTDLTSIKRCDMPWCLLEGAYN